MEIKSVKVGNTYRDGWGKLIFIKYKDDDDQFPFVRSDGAHYSPDGKWSKHPSNHDLVEEVGFLIETRSAKMDLLVKLLSEFSDYELTDMILKAADVVALLQHRTGDVDLIRKEAADLFKNIISRK